MTRRTLLKATAASFLSGMPALACDCHTHIYGDSTEFPLSPNRSYTPLPALPDQMSALHRSLGIARVVIVTPSVYGTDNSATLYGLKTRGSTARGIAVIDDKTSDNELDNLHRAGIRGIRINNPAITRDQFQAAIARIRQRDWHLQIFTGLTAAAALKPLVQEAPVPVVFDHFGGAVAARGLEQSGFRDLLSMVASGRAYVKISGAYRASTEAPDYPDVTPLAKALIAANPDRILWGSDWPHPNTTPSRPDKPTPFLPIDDLRLLNRLALWAPDAGLRRKILVENPARLYRF